MHLPEVQGQAGEDQKAEPQVAVVTCGTCRHFVYVRGRLGSCAARVSNGAFVMRRDDSSACGFWERRAS